MKELIQQLNNLPGQPSTFGSWKWQPKHDWAVARAKYKSDRSRLVAVPGNFTVKCPQNSTVWGSRLTLTPGEMDEVAGYLRECNVVIENFMTPKPWDDWKVGDTLEQCGNLRSVILTLEPELTMTAKDSSSAVFWYPTAKDAYAICWRKIEILEHETWKADDVLERGAERIVVVDRVAPWQIKIRHQTTPYNLSPSSLYDVGWRRMKGPSV